MAMKIREGERGIMRKKNERDLSKKGKKKERDLVK